jgi:HlyD family secretion protein
MKLLLMLGVGLVVIVGGVAAVGMKMRSALSSTSLATPVRVEAASDGDLVEIISAPGEIQPRTKVSVSARVSASILELPYKEGDAVTKGDPASKKTPSLLVRLDARDLEAALRSATARKDAQEAGIAVDQQHIASSNAQIIAARANLDDAERDLKRQLGLLDTKDVSQSLVDTAQTKVDGLRAQLDASKFTLLADKENLTVMRHQLDAAAADIEKAKGDLSYTVITSPIDGVVTRLKAEVGEMVVPGIQSSPGTTIMEVSDLSQMLMVARVDESSVAQVKKDQRATIRIQGFPDKTFEGTVESVALSRADETSTSARSAAQDGGRYFEAKIRLDIKGLRIPTGLSADADIETRRQTGIRVPSQSVLGRAMDTLSPEARAKPEADSAKSIATVVFRHVNGKAVLTPVTVGPSDETHTLVKSGLKEGDQVIAGPYKVLETLTDGQDVKAEPAKSTTRPASPPASAPATMPATAPAN